MQTLEEFRDALKDTAPPSMAGPELQALWWAGKGEWDRAHQIAGAHEGRSTCDLVHAHLHRQRGDHDGALSWYADAGEPASELPISDEWDELVRRMLSHQSTDLPTPR